MTKEIYRGMIRQILDIALSCEGCEFEKEVRKILKDAEKTIKRNK